MRNVAICFVLLRWLGMVVAYTQQISRVPPVIRAALDKHYAGWRLVEVSQEVKAYFARERVAFSPNLLVGDFNDHGKSDYALLIEYRNRIIPLAFLNKG